MNQNKDKTHPPRNAPTGFRTAGSVPTAEACDLLLVVWKLRRSRVEAEEGVKEVEVRAVRPRRERARVVDIVVVAVSGEGWVWM